VTTHISTKIVDEIYLNNQRANLLFDDYFKNGRKTFETCAVINDTEKYYLPDSLNHQRCNYIKYGQSSIGNILTANNRHYADSMLHQLEKLETQSRRFIYYVRMNENSENFLNPKNTKRDYTIHFNLKHDATSFDIMQSYYLGRLIDSNLQHAQSKTENNKLSAQLTI
jgi:hypothetical protein